MVFSKLHNFAFTMLINCVDELCSLTEVYCQILKDDFPYLYCNFYFDNIEKRPCRI